MKIDVHCHLWDEKVPSRVWFDAMVNYGAAVSGSDPAKVRRKIHEGNHDLTGDMLIRDMDEAGIEKAAIHVLDVGLYAGVGEDDSVPLETQHRMYAEAVKRHPNRLIAFAGVDPRRPDAVKMIEKAVKEWDFRAVKLWTPAGFAPNDKSAYLVFAAAQRLGIPVWIHSGPEIPPFYMTTARTILISEVAAHFPECKIVIAHAGDLWWREGAYVASHNPNVYLDIADWQVTFLHSPVRFYRELRDLISWAGPKVFFGSDWPATRLVRRANLTNWVKAITEPTDAIKQAGVEFTKAEIDGLMGDNAAKFMKW